MIRFGTRFIYLRFKDTEGQYSIVKGGAFQICDQPASPTVSEDIAACQGNTIMLTSSSASPGITYYWEGPSGFNSTQQNITISNVNTTNAGTYKSYAVVSGNCLSTASEVELSVVLLPSSAGNILTTATECKDATVFFVPFINNATNYEWTFPSGINIFAGNNTNNISVTFAGYIGSFNLQVRGSNTCGTSAFSAPLNVNTCFCRDVRNTNDGGLSSLRNAVGCANPNDTIMVDPLIIGQNINISSGFISINNNLTLQPPSENGFQSDVSTQNRYLSNPERLSIVNTTNEEIFRVQPGKSLILNKVDLFVGNEIEAVGVLNSGNLTLKDTHIYQNINFDGTAIINQPGGSILIQGQTKILKEE